MSDNEETNEVYKERDLCVALIASYAQWFGHRVGMGKHVGESWEDDWRNILFINLPTGQVSWHIHDSEVENFPDIQPYLGVWDGHTTEEKYKRIQKYIHLLKGHRGKG